jgi:hypothetical protein
MKIAQIKRLIDNGGFSSTKEWEVIENHIKKAIETVDWPPGSGSFTLFDQSGKKRGQGSGVKPIKDACMNHLKSLGWSLETPIPIAVLKKPGKMDATYPVGNRLFCVEWETGNISSSHRAMNKMALGILKGILIGGALILPTRAMYKYLTDRIGNFSELEPYFPLWKAFKVEEGLLEVIAVEHDSVSRSVPRIPKGTNGRAIQ